MEAFPYQLEPFLLDSIFLPNTAPINDSVLMEEEVEMNANNFSEFYLPEPVRVSPDDAKFHGSGSVSPCSKVVVVGENEPSLTRRQSSDSSTVVDKLESGEQVTQSVRSVDRKKRTRNGAYLSSAESKETKSKRQRKCGGRPKTKEEEEEEEPKDGDKEDQKKEEVPEEPPKGYIHVRARRGQATDSHSLAERVRREKISERMKTLQCLVPGCDKVTGKALMLDEIINYVQSLQNQVEFLSMKIASTNLMFYDFGTDMNSFLIRPDQRLSTNQAMAFSSDHITTSNTFLPVPASNYHVMDAASASASLLLHHQQQRPNDFHQDNMGLLWAVEDRRQKLLNSSRLGENICSLR